MLVLLPSTTDKLMAHWQGPYEVIRAIGRVNYEIRMHDHKKKKCIFHINMLKPWTDPPELPEEMLLATEEDGTSDLDVDWRFDNLTAPLTVGSKLTQQQREQLQQLLEQNGQLLSDKPGRIPSPSRNINPFVRCPIVYQRPTKRKSLGSFRKCYYMELSSLLLALGRLQW